MSEKKNEISLLKKVLYLVGVLLLFGLLLLLSTGIAQLVKLYSAKYLYLQDFNRISIRNFVCENTSCFSGTVCSLDLD